MTSRTDPLVVFDLDGTVITENSFPLWARFMLGGLCSGVPLIAASAPAGRWRWRFWNASSPAARTAC